MSKPERHACPYCTEAVNLEAVVCPHCRSAIWITRSGHRFRRSINAVPVGRFRSRLEYRWYRVLDAAGLRPEYEAHGFSDLRVPYLPDFYLPTLSLWLEIKPRLVDDEGRDKARLLSERTQEPVVIACGAPEQNEAFLTSSRSVFITGAAGWIIRGCRILSGPILNQPAGERIGS
jgi:hypothetical protein